MIEHVVKCKYLLINLLDSLKMTHFLVDVREKIYVIQIKNLHQLVSRYPSTLFKVKWWKYDTRIFYSSIT